MIQEMLNFVWLVVLFGIFWILGAIGHELFHGLTCFLQGCKFRIEVWWFTLTGKIKLPSMRCVSEGKLTNEDMFYYLGGIGVGVTFLIGSFIFAFFYMSLFIVLFIIGVIHSIYGVYEGLCIRNMELDDYMKRHYIIYLIGFAIGLLMIANPIINYIW